MGGHFGPAPASRLPEARLVSAPFGVNDDVVVGERLATIVVPELRAAPGRALVAYPDGERELVPHREIAPAPDGAAERAAGLRERFPQG